MRARVESTERLNSRVARFYKAIAQKKICEKFCFTLIHQFHWHFYHIMIPSVLNANGLQNKKNNNLNNENANK